MEDQGTADAVARIPLFGGLSADERELVARASRMLHVDAGAILVNEGEFAFDVYAIVSGAADVVQHGERVAGLACGAVFGELGVVPGAGRPWTRRRNASVIATRPTRALAIDGRTFRRLVEEIAALAEAVDAMADGRRGRA